MSASQYLIIYEMMSIRDGEKLKTVYFFVNRNYINQSSANNKLLPHQSINAILAGHR